MRLSNGKVTLWGRNLTDKDYYVRGFGSFGNDPRNFYVTEPYFQYGEPRVTGGDLAAIAGWLMTDFLSSALDQFHQNSLLELTAVIFAVAYLLLAVRQHIACWYAAFISTAIFLYIFWQVNLYMESGLQVYYLGMAVYGWWAWRQGNSGTNPGLRISTWSTQATPDRHRNDHGGDLCQRHPNLSGTDQRLGYLDSFTTWGAIVATFMVDQKDPGKLALLDRY